MTNPRVEPGEGLRERLQGVRLFREMDGAGFDELLSFARVESLRRKTVVYSEGEAHRGAWIVLDGLVVVYRLSPDGRMLILRVCRPGASFGESGLFDDSRPRHAHHARTTRDAALLFLPRAKYGAFLRRHPEACWRLLEELSDRNRELSTTLEGVAFREVTARLARYLVRELEAAGRTDETRPSVDLPLAKGSLASYLGAAHETLSRSLRRLSRQGIVQVDGPRVTVLDLPRLRRLA